jgi:hypothetical protein
MTKLIKISFGILATIIAAILLMSFIPMSEEAIKQEIPTELVPSELPSASSLYVSWSTIEVNFNYSGHYVVRYSDNVSGLAPNHTISWGCGNIDLDPNASG